MSDWQSVVMQPPVISTHDPRSGSSSGAAMAIVNTATTWPAANRALYMPVEIQNVCTAYQIAFGITTQSGNCDVGIYDVAGNRLVSAGSTPIAATSIQVIDITDTLLAPGVYFIAMNVDNILAVINGFVTAALVLQTLGIQQQAVGGVTLPNPATFANPASAFIPALYVSTMLATI